MTVDRTSRSELWHHRDFLVFWSGQSLSQIGSRITREGLPLAAVLTLGAQPLMMGWLQVVSAVPVMVLGLVTGVAMDRFRRRPFLIATDVLRFAALLLVPIAALTGWLHMWVLFLSAAVTSILGMVFTSAYEAYLPNLVGRRFLFEANTKLFATESFAEIVGPALAGVLVQSITAPLAVLIDAFTYLISAFSVTLIKSRESTPVQLGEHAKVSSAIRQGLSAIFENEVLRALTLAAATSSLFSGIVFTMDVLFAIRTLHLGPALFGLTVTFGGIGAIVGSLIAESVTRRFGYGRLLVLSAVLDGVCSWLIPLAHGPVWLAAVFLMGAQLLGDLFGVLFGVLETTLRQAVTPDEVLGRVNSTINLLTATLNPVGALLGAWIASAYSLRAAMALGVGGITISALWLVRPSILRLQRLPECPAPRKNLS